MSESKLVNANNKIAEKVTKDSIKIENISVEDQKNRKLYHREFSRTRRRNL